MNGYRVLPGVVRSSLVESVRQASLLGTTIISCYPYSFRLVRMNQAGDRAILTARIDIVRVGN